MLKVIYSPEAETEFLEAIPLSTALSRTSGRRSVYRSCKSVRFTNCVRSEAFSSGGTRYSTMCCAEIPFHHLLQGNERPYSHSCDCAHEPESRVLEITDLTRGDFRERAFPRTESRTTHTDSRIAGSGNEGEAPRPHGRGYKKLPQTAPPDTRFTTELALLIFLANAVHAVQNGGKSRCGGRGIGQTLSYERYGKLEEDGAVWGA